MSYHWFIIIFNPPWRSIPNARSIFSLSPVCYAYTLINNSSSLRKFSTYKINSWRVTQKTDNDKYKFILQAFIKLEPPTKWIYILETRSELEKLIDNTRLLSTNWKRKSSKQCYLQAEKSGRRLKSSFFKICEQVQNRHVLNVSNICHSV